MRDIHVTAERDYLVKFTHHWQDTLSAAVGNRSAVVIAPHAIADSVASKIGDVPLIRVEDGEAQKSTASFVKLLESLSQLGIDRSGVIIGIGGGATTDVAGFLAATYLRGVSWIAVPTSVAGMVDAAIGGKTGLNLPTGKNLVGAFHSPELVIVDTNWTKTLSTRDQAAGLAEALKCGFIADQEILHAFDGSELNLDEIIHRSIAVKAAVVSEDFKESFAREALNYGHTLGHAIERHSNYELRHGEAISIGMIFAASLSVKVAGLDPSVLELHRRLLQKLNLPTEYSASACDELIVLMSSDKKRKGGEIRFVTLPRIGSTDRYATADSNTLREIYHESFAG